MIECKVVHLPLLLLYINSTSIKSISTCISSNLQVLLDHLQPSFRALSVGSALGHLSARGQRRAWWGILSVYWIKRLLKKFLIAWESMVCWLMLLLNPYEFWTTNHQPTPTNYVTFLPSLEHCDKLWICWISADSIQQIECHRVQRFHRVGGSSQ